MCRRTPFAVAGARLEALRQLVIVVVVVVPLVQGASAHRIEDGLLKLDSGTRVQQRRMLGAQVTCPPG